MTGADQTEVTKLLDDWQSGNMAARDQLFEYVYEELRVISAAMLRREGRISLSIGDLVNEAATRLIGLETIEWQDKAHFMALASRMMRRVLIDHIRKKDSDKRQHHKVTLHTGALGGARENLDLQALEEAMIRLQVIDAQKAEIVEMRYYGGLSLEEIGVVIGASPSTVKRSWRAARAWLLAALEEARENRR